jgi:membrane-bound lytic murein transglycosylase A
MCFIQGQTPAPDGGVAPFMRLVLNQDTGGAIRGPGRLDLFYGTGPLAGELAGRMKYEGRLFFLAPKLP